MCDVRLGEDFGGLSVHICLICVVLVLFVGEGTALVFVSTVAIDEDISAERFPILDYR